MILDTLAFASFVLAIIPAVLYLDNVRRYRRAPASDDMVRASILIPARNEEATINAAIESALASRAVEIEVVVLDDHSEDRTAAIVESSAEDDSRVRLVRSAPLPPGWCGKQFACAQLAEAARHPLLVFVDADVRLASDGVSRLAAFQRQSGVSLVSGIPRQVTVTFFERLLIPLIHFLLLGYLPLLFMRRSRHPAFGAGCGQLFLTTKAAYDHVGGHAAIRGSRHDGITLPRAYRRAGLTTDLCDATDLAHCRMYRSGAAVLAGLAKNATEGMASPRGIWVWTVLLVGGHVLPWALAAVIPGMERWPAIFVTAAIAAGLSLRLHAAWRFQQSWLGAVLHPVGVTALVTIQWFALMRELAGRPIGWRGRGVGSIGAVTAPPADSALFPN